MYVKFLKPQQKGRNFQVKMLNFQYSMDNVSNSIGQRFISFDKDPKAQLVRVSQNIFALFVICPIICSFESHFVQPHVVCPRLAVPTFWTPGSQSVSQKH